MTYIPNNTGMLSVEDSRRILSVIFPNYPELKPCNLAPPLEPIAPPPLKTALSLDGTFEGASGMLRVATCPI